VGINIGNLMMVPSIEMQAQQATQAAKDIKIVVEIEMGHLCQVTKRGDNNEF